MNALYKTIRMIAKILSKVQFTIILALTAGFLWNFLCPINITFTAIYCELLISAKWDGLTRYLWVNIGKHGCEFIKICITIACSHLLRMFTSNATT